MSLVMLTYENLEAVVSCEEGTFSAIGRRLPDNQQLFSVGRDGERLESLAALADALDQYRALVGESLEGVVAEHGDEPTHFTHLTIGGVFAGIEEPVLVPA